MTTSGDTIVDGRSAVPVSIFMAAGTVTAAAGIDRVGPWSTPISQTITAGNVTTIDPTKCPVAPWYKFTTTGGGGTLIMQERTGEPL